MGQAKRYSATSPSDFLSDADWVPDVGPPEYVNANVGPDRTLPCLDFALHVDLVAQERMYGYGPFGSNPILFELNEMDGIGDDAHVVWVLTTNRPDRGLDLELDDEDRVVARTTGVPASFVKELLPTATLAAAEGGRTAVTDADVGVVLDELLHETSALTRVLLGAGTPRPAAPHPHAWLGGMVEGAGEAQAQSVGEERP